MSVLISNWTLRNQYHKRGLVVDKYIKLEEELDCRKPKFGYGSTFRTDSRTSDIPTRSQSAPPRSIRKQQLLSRPVSQFAYRDCVYTPNIYDKTPHQSVGTFKLYKRTSTPLKRRETRKIPLRSSSCRSTPTGNPDNEVTLDDIYARNQTNDYIQPDCFPDSEFESSLSGIMLSPNPPLPGGGLARSNTSMAVYSNLAAHNRPSEEQKRPRTAVLPVVKSGEQFKLLQAVKKSDIAQVEAILEDNKNMNLRYIDDNDNTVLHYCFDIQKKSVNMDILKLLFKRKPPLDDYGKSSTPVLHIAARMGHTYGVYLLLKHGADINVQNKVTYRTALHEAVTNGHRPIVELLLYNGANENLREREGRAASDFCRENVFARKDYSLIQELVADNRIDIQEINHQSITRFTNTRVSVRLQQTQAENVPVIVRRQNYESRTADVVMAEQEEVTSDLYYFRSVRTDCDVNVVISLPLFQKSCSSREIVVVKTISGKKIGKCETETDKENMVITFAADISQSDTFVTTCRPTIEQWQVGKVNTVLGSIVDEGVRINISKSTFNTNALITLQIIELPEDIEIKEGQILASTPFYKIDVDVKPNMDITVDLPKPGSLGEDGDTMILLKVDDYWKAVETQDDEKRRTVSFKENMFPIIASVVRAKTGTGSSTETMVTESKETLAQALNMTYNICFLCYTERISNTRSFNVFVECCRSIDVDSRRRYWKGQGYDEQTGKDSRFTINTSSKTGFKLVFYESAITRKNPRIIDLEFHRKRSNVIQFVVELKGKSIQFINGRLFLYLSSKQNGNKFDLTEQPQHLTYMDVNLLLNPAETVLSGVSGSTSSSLSNGSSRSRTGSLELQLSVRPKSRSARSTTSSKGSRNPPSPENSSQDSLTKLQNSLAKAMKNVDPVVEETIPEITVTNEDGDTQQQQPPQLQPPQQQQQQQQQEQVHLNGTDFLDSNMLEMIVEELGDDWYKVLVLMGVNFVEIEDEIFHTRSTSFVQRKLFLQWKDSNQTREDCGIPLLLGALFKGGCRNIATTVQVQLRQWHEKWKDNGEEFTDWVTKAYKNADMLVPSDYPKPMTDAYLVLMSDELPLSRKLAHALLIGDSEADDILQSPAYVLDGIRVMKILTMFRDRTQRAIDALETLISCLGDMGFVKLKHYAVMCAKAWLKRTATRRDDPFRYQVDQLMNKLD